MRIVAGREYRFVFEVFLSNTDYTCKQKSYSHENIYIFSQLLHCLLSDNVRIVSDINMNLKVIGTLRSTVSEGSKTYDAADQSTNWAVFGKRQSVSRSDHRTSHAHNSITVFIIVY